MSDFVEITLPDGRVARFPKGMSRQEMADALNSFPSAPDSFTSDSQAVDELGGKLGSLYDGAVQGATFGLQDEIAGVRGWMTGDGYEAARDEQRAHNERSREENPLPYMAGDIAGSTAVGVAALPATGGGSILGNMGRGMIAGGVEGGLHGGGRSDGGDIVSDTLWGTGLGALIGMGAPAIVGATGAARNYGTGVVDALIDRANTGKANRAVSKLMHESNQTPDDVSAAIAKAASEGQPEYRLMDATGVAGQRQASGIARSGGKPGADIADFLEQRQMGQGERVGSFVDDAFEVKGTTAAKTEAGLKQARSDAANIAYDAARGNSAPVDVRGAISVIDDRIGGMKGSNVKGDGIDGKLAGYRSRLVADPAPNGEISRELSDFDRVLGVKQEIQDDIGAAVRAGRNNEARELGKLASELDAALEASSDMYRTANDGFREASSVIDALGEGKAMARPSRRAADTTEQFNAMTPDQQAAARVGYGDDLLTKLEAVAAPTTNRAKPLQSPKRVAEADAMAVDPRLYADRLARENEMWLTQNRALGGSRTADNIADQEAIEGLAGGAIGALRNSHGLIDMSVKLADTLAPHIKGQNEATRSLIADILMSSDPSKALADAMRQDMVSNAQSRVVEALMRNSTREPAMDHLVR